MEITCHHCDGTGISPLTEQTCHVCGGDGDIEPSGVHAITEAHAIANYKKLVALETKIETIATQVQALFDDLNP